MDQIDNLIKFSPTKEEMDLLKVDACGELILDAPSKIEQLALSLSSTWAGLSLSFFFFCTNAFLKVGPYQFFFP